MTQNKPYECPTSILLSVNKADPGSTKNHLKYTLQQPFYPAVILHPSLGCPLIVDEQGKNKISLFLVAGKNFRKTFKIGSVGKQGGNSIKLVIGAALSIIPWDTEGTVLKNPGKAQMIYPDRQTVFDKITCTYLGELGLELKDASLRHFANIRTATRNQLKKHELEYLFQITLKDVGVIQQGGMFEVFWSVRNEQPVDSDYDKDFLDFPNRLVRELVRNTFYNIEAANGEREADKTVKPGPDRAYKIKDSVVDGVDEQGNPKQVPIKTLDFGSFDDKVPLMMRHPIYVSAKKSLNIGHIGDMHITARQHAYKGKEATVIPGAELKVSPYIGNTTGNNLETCLELMDSIGNAEKDIDLLFVAGDLYDYMHDFDPSRLAENKTGKLWEAMYVTEENDVRKRIEDYPYGINALAFYTLLLYFYNTYQKPVMMISGNHEGYRYPYGISPRLKVKDLEIMKANEGIPLDHNLTFYEAILLYGPGYDKVLREDNFTPKNFDWFFTAFSPFADYVVTFGDQCLVCMEWGDDESFIESFFGGGGSLPRAESGGASRQIALGEAALTLPQSNKILCTHYTLVNYEPGYALSDEGFAGGNFTYTQYEYGSAWCNRDVIYGDWLKANRFRYTLAGHAHRVGLYKCTPESRDNMLKRLGATARSNFAGLADPTAILGRVLHPVDNAMNITRNSLPKLKTQGYLPTPEVLASWGNETRIIVSSSAGCLAKQNYEGEMSGKGMDFPAATLLYFNGQERIEIMKTNHPRAKPRFCVACDYIDLTGGGFWESFKAVGNGGTFELKPFWQKIHPKLSEKAKTEMIESMTLYLVGGDGTNPVSFTQDLLATKALFGDAVRWRSEFESNLALQIKYYSGSLDALFLSIKFNGLAFKGLPGFDHYDFTSPWNIQVGIYSGDFEVTEDPEANVPSWYKENPKFLKHVQKRKQMIADVSSWEIRRHKKFGEIPDHKDRAKRWPFEYGYKLDSHGA